MNIYFCGMIGSGKTTIGRHLARILRRDFYDLDQEMDRKLGYSFHKLVEKEGWVPFRELEYSICKRFAKLADSIICLGGGTVRYEWNLDVIRGSGLIILLTASLEELIKRVKVADRPRVNVGTSLEEDIRIIWEKSGDRYLSAADVVYATDQKTIAEEIQDLKKIIADWEYRNGGKTDRRPPQ
jgi:shikimate kinase